MASFKEKLQTFEYVVESLIREGNRRLEELTITETMKVLYFVVLENALIHFNENALIHSKDSSAEGVLLLKVFDSFRAYPNGPVEEEIYLRRYEQREHIYTYVGPGFYRLSDVAPLDVTSFGVRGLELRHAVDEAIKSLKSKGYFAGEKTCGDMIAITHDLPAWSNCYIDLDEDRLGRSISGWLRNPNNLSKELSAFRDKLDKR